MKQHEPTTKERSRNLKKWLKL